jgi:O-antigen ligase
MKKTLIISLALLILLLPFKDLFWFGEFWNALKLYTPFIIYLFLIAYLMGELKLSRFWTNVLFLLIFLKILSFFGSYLNGYPLNLWGLSRDLANILIFIFVANLISEKKDLKKISYVLVLTIFFANILLLLIYFTNRGILYKLGMELTTASERGGIGNPDDFGNYLIWVAPICAYFLIQALNEKSKNLFKLGFLTLNFILLFIATIITFSRAAFFILILICGLILIKEKILFRKEVLVSFLFIIAIFGLTALKDLSFRDYLRERFLITPSKIAEVYHNEPAFQLRKKLAKTAVILFSKSPVFGIGPQNIVKEGVKISGLELTSENVYLEILAENGIIFFVAWFWILFILFRKLQKIATNNHYSLAFRYSFYAMLLGGLFNSLVGHDPFAFIMLGVIFSNAFLSNFNKE